MAHFVWKLIKSAHPEPVDRVRHSLWRRRKDMSTLYNEDEHMLQYKHASIIKYRSIMLATMFLLITFPLHAFPRFGFFNRKGPSQKVAHHELKGIALTQQELEAVQQAQHGALTPEHEQILAELDKKTGKRTIIEDQLFWHHAIPTTGLVLKGPLTYPYIPHMLSLWQLAPSKGKGVTVAIIDTGIAEPLAHECTMHDQLNMMHSPIEDPIEKFITVLRSYTKEEIYDDALPHNVAQWIYDYATKGEVAGALEYARQHGVDREEELLAALAGSKHGADALPTVRGNDQLTTYIAGHGTHTYGLIGGKHGLAPEAKIIMIKAFNDNGTSNKATLIAGLRRALELKSDVVNLGLKIADTLDTQAPLSQLLEKMIGAIPYVVAASGNSAYDEAQRVAPTEAYPARFKSVAFDVGAFNLHKKTCSIGAFSQYEKGVGPKFVAPGANIVSYGLVPKQTEDIMYLFMDGTSPATALMTGFVTLMVSEFQHDFTKEELLKVCSKAVVRMHNDDSWQSKVFYGVLDMRTALFILHVMRQARKASNDRSFDALLDSVCTAIFAHPRDYAAQRLRSVDFTQDFMKYIARAHKKRKKFKMERYIENFKREVTLDYLVELVASKLLSR